MLYYCMLFRTGLGLGLGLDSVSDWLEAIHSVVTIELVNSI